MWSRAKLKNERVEELFAVVEPLEGRDLFSATPVLAATSPTLEASKHPGGVNVMMGDGSVRFVSSSISTVIW